MKWLTALETDHDPITLCRLMNVFRRKGVSIANLTMSVAKEGYTLLALVETGAGEIEHLRQFLRGVAGVTKVACYRHESVNDVAVDFDHAEPASLSGFIESLPGASVTFHGDGRYLVEYAVRGRGPAIPATTELVDSAFLPN